MKTTKKMNQTQKSTGKVRIKFHSDGAHAVFIAGTFNDWRPEVTPMISLGDGEWIKELSLAPGRYEFRCKLGQVSKSARFTLNGLPQK